MTRQLPLLNKKDIAKARKISNKRAWQIFLMVCLLSVFFWLKGKVPGWWQEIQKPAVIRVTKEENLKSDNSLFGDIESGFKLEDRQKMIKTLESFLNKLKGTYGIYVYNLKDSEKIGINQDEVFDGASVNKLPILITYFQQVENNRISPEDIYILKQGQIQDYGTGSIRYQEPGTKYAYEELARIMIKQSDNTAAYVFQDEIVGIKNVQKTAEEIGMRDTDVYENVTTPQDAGLLLRKLYQDELVSKANKQRAYEFLTETEFEDRLPAGVPSDVRVAHKIGTLQNIVHDCGIVFADPDYVICLMSKDILMSEAEQALPEIARLVYQYVTKTK